MNVHGRGRVDGRLALAILVVLTNLLAKKDALILRKISFSHTTRLAPSFSENIFLFKKIQEGKSTIRKMEGSENPPEIGWTCIYYAW